MRCPFCGDDDTQVKDSRPTDDGSAIRRRRACPGCGARFTTFERIQLRELTVVKSSGAKEPFEREKLLRSMRTALRKRPIDADRLDRVVNSIVRQLEASGESEIPTREIGAAAMEALRQLDQVAYVRFASVYRDFREANDFNEFIEELREPDATPVPTKPSQAGGRAVPARGGPPPAMPAGVGAEKGPTRRPAVPDGEPGRLGPLGLPTPEPTGRRR